MAIALDTERQSYPTVRFRWIDQAVTGMVVDRFVRQSKEYGSDEVKLGKNGKPRHEEVLTLILMEGSTAAVGKGEDDREPVVGEVVRWIVKSKTYGSLIDARKKLDGVPMVGDVVRAVYGKAVVMKEGKVLETFSTNDEIRTERMKPNPRVIVPEIEVKVRRAKPEEAALVAKAEQQYHLLHNQGVALAEPSAPAPTVDPDDVW